MSYAWVILAVLFIGQAAAFGMRSSFGAYISPWEEDFSANRTLVTSISMLSFIVFAIGQPLTGKLNEQLGRGIVPTFCLFLMGTSLLLTSLADQMWQMLLLYGVGFSLGVSGCCSAVTAAIANNWFVEKRGLAFGLVLSGMAVGQLILVPANLFIIDMLGWRATAMTMSIVFMAVVGPLFIFCLRTRPEEKGLKPYGYKEPGDNDNKGSKEGETLNRNTLPVTGVLKLRAFWLMAVSYFVCGFTDVGLMQTHLIPIISLKGFPIAITALVFGLIAVFNIAGTVVSGHLSDHFSRPRLIAIVYIIRAASYVLLVFIKRPWLLIVFSLIYGSVEGASIAPTNSLIIQLFNKFSIGTVLGIIVLCHHLGGAFGSWIPGIIYDITNSYTALLTFSAFLLAGAALTVLRVKEPGVYNN